MEKYRKKNKKLKGKITEMENQEEILYIFSGLLMQKAKETKYILIIILKSEDIKTDSTSQTSVAEAKKNQYR